MIVIGIDPGLTATGFACLRAGLVGDRPGLVEAGVIRLGRGGVAARLAELERDLALVLTRAKPTAACVESLFSHFAHPRTAVSMAHARGVILLVCQRAGIRLVELPPAAVKKAVTGTGRATKTQVQAAVMEHLGLAGPAPPPDAADALAIAICGCRRLSLSSTAVLDGAHPVSMPSAQP